MKQAIFVLTLPMLIAGCSREPVATPAGDMDAVALEYLLLELSAEKYDPGHVDAYFGPAGIRKEAVDRQPGIDDIHTRAAGLREQLGRYRASSAGGTDTLRIDGLVNRLTALETRLALRQGIHFTFDEESRLLFGAVAPDHDADHFKAILDDIDQLLGGDGPLPDRVAAFREQFVIPPERLGDVFDAAIAECRRRTLLHMTLPADESFGVEYVNNKPWSAYNWYQGNAHSLIQVNTDLPHYISRAIDLGCHEGYPGHHTYNTLLEKNLVQDRGWLEFSLYPLFSPQSLIAEGSGNYGIELAFPGEERIEFEKTVLFPLAGLDAAEADRYYALLALLDRLEYAGNEAARDYLNGTIDREQAVQWLVDYALMSPERARQRTDFFDTYRSYVINYNLGKDIVREYIETNNADLDERWRRFEALLSSGMTAADMRQ